MKPLTLLALFAPFTVACLGSSPDSPTTNPTADAGPAAAPQGTTCLGILTCVQKQSCSDDACVDACMKQGTQDAQTAVTNLATCYQTNACQDAACLQSNCASELGACVSESAPPKSGQPMTGGSNVPAGSVPPSFVGTWSYMDGFDPGSETSWTFDANGTASYSNAYSGGLSNCTNTTLIRYDGNAVIDGTSITLYATKAQTMTDTCGIESTMPETASTLTFTYTFNDDGTMHTIDSTCAAQYAPSETTNINLYCGATFTKQ